MKSFVKTSTFFSENVSFCPQEWWNTHACFSVINFFVDLSCWASSGLEILLQCPRCNERGKEGDCRASWKYELTKWREALACTSLCPRTSWKSPSKKIFLSVYLSHCIYSIYFCLHHSIFLLLFSLSLSLSPLIQRLTFHTQEQTEISIHVVQHSLATLTNGSMQLTCTHSKRPFEYSSANSCIHWYLKCSGSARALNPWYIWLNLTKKR